MLQSHNMEHSARAWNIPIGSLGDQIWPRPLATASLEVNPVAAVPKLRGVNKPSSVTLTGEQIKLAWNVCKKYNSAATPLAFRFHVSMAGIRTMESIERRWDEIQIVQGVECLVIPPESTKMGREHIVPIGRHAKAVMEEVREFTGHREVMFPMRGANATPLVYSALGSMMRRLRKEYPDLGSLAPRYIRRFVKTTLGDRNVDRHSLDLFHAHALPGSAVSTKHYDRSVRLTEKLEVINAWDDYLDELL
jgi:integrase